MESSMGPVPCDPSLPDYFRVFFFAPAFFLAGAFPFFFLAGAVPFRVPPFFDIFFPAFFREAAAAFFFAAVFFIFFFPLREGAALLRVADGAFMPAARTTRSMRLVVEWSLGSPTISMSPP